ncbi:hypothetical protein [Waddlia chondrophila]|uniref:Uncharacterized protein n=2 Tax=Waddlia chondrophila TaxID=71667 RepID=D6YUQ9_WADCW|nr:hypothetical protein [Waddlia chondrophila]ADI37870.1 hypothetical protein wcw_0499 [Waddlia chondrophila WSU 86-1044]
MSIQGDYPFSMSPLLDSGFKTWTVDFEETIQYQMVYVREFSEDKKQVMIRTLDWENDECLTKARNLVANRLIGALQTNKEGVVLWVSDKLKPNFEKGRELKVVYQGKDTSTDICDLRGIAFLNETKFAETTPWFREFCIKSAQRRTEKSSV